VKQLRISMLVLCVILGGAGFAKADLSGSWALTVIVEPFSMPYLILSGALNISVSFGDTVVSSISLFNSAGWTKQDFTLSGGLRNIDFDTTIKFDPSTATFESWRSSFDWSDTILAISSSFECTSTSGSLSVGATGGLGDLTVGATLRLGSNGDRCSLLYQSLAVTIDWPTSCGSVSSSFSFACSGFSAASLSVSGAEVTGLPWLTLAVKLSYKLEEKTLCLSPSVNLGNTGCVEVMSDIDFADHLRATAVLIKGLKLSCRSGAISFESLSYIDGIHFVEGDYWESLRLSYNQSGCCGSISGSVQCLFLQEGVRLFDIARLRAETAVSLASSVKLTGSIDFDLDIGQCDKLSLVVAVSW